MRRRRTKKEDFESLPDEAFGRLRGAIFCGAGFRPTRNKLTMSDDLAEALTRATAHDRHLERSFRDWISRCHREYDKGVAFKRVLPNSMQAQIRTERGEEDVTAFNAANIRGTEVAAGDVVALRQSARMGSRSVGSNLRDDASLTLGVVIYFLAPAAVKAGGSFAGGKVVVRPLPEEAYGVDAQMDTSIKCLQVLAPGQAEPLITRARNALPSAVRVISPRFLAAAQCSASQEAAYPPSLACTLAAGTTFPDAIRLAIHNGEGARTTRATLPVAGGGAASRHLTVRFEIRKFAELPISAEADAEARGRCFYSTDLSTKKAADGVLEIASPDDASDGKVSKLQPFTQSGFYRIAYHIKERPTVSSCAWIAVSAGPPATAKLRPPADGSTAWKLPLGVPSAEPLSIFFKDASGNECTEAPDAPSRDDLKISVRGAEESLAVSFESISHEGSHWNLQGVVVAATSTQPTAAPDDGNARTLFLDALASDPACATAPLATATRTQTRSSRRRPGADEADADADADAGGKAALPTANVILVFAWDKGTAAEVPSVADELAIELVPGAPCTMQLQDDKEPPSLRVCIGAELAHSFAFVMHDKLGHRTAPLPGMRLEWSSDIVEARSGLLSSDIGNCHEDVTRASTEGIVVRPDVEEGTYAMAISLMQDDAVLCKLDVSLDAVSSREPHKLLLRLDGSDLPCIGTAAPTPEFPAVYMGQTQALVASREIPLYRFESPVKVGTTLNNLTCVMVDNAGRPVWPRAEEDPALLAHLRISWMGANKRTASACQSSRLPRRLA